jgi:hypothetical protein
MRHPRKGTAMKRTPTIVAGLLAVVLAPAALTACGTTTTPSSARPTETSPVGDIPDNQAYVVYTSPAGGFTIKVPEGWARTEAGGAVSFTDKLNTIRIETATAASAPTESSARADLQTVQAAAKGFVAGKVSTVTRPAGTGVLVTYQADAAPDPVTGKVINDDVERYQFFHNGQLATITLSGPHGADNVDPWRIITDSVTWSR